MKSVSVAEAKAKLSALLGEVLHRGERIVVRRRGKAVAALVPMEDLERVEKQAGGDWLDGVAGMLADSPEVAEAIDEVVAERGKEMPRERRFPWEDE